MHPRIAHQFLFSTTLVRPTRLVKAFAKHQRSTTFTAWKGWQAFLRRRGLLRMKIF